MGSALDAAKEYLALPVTITVDQVAHKRLAALVAEIDAAPVASAKWTAVLGIDSLFVSPVSEADAARLQGQRAALLRVGEGE